MSSFVEQLTLWNDVFRVSHWIKRKRNARLVLPNVAKPAATFLNKQRKITTSTRLSQCNKQVYAKFDAKHALLGARNSPRNSTINVFVTILHGSRSKYRFVLTDDPGAPCGRVREPFSSHTRFPDRTVPIAHRAISLPLPNFARVPRKARATKERYRQCRSCRCTQRCNFVPAKQKARSNACIRIPNDPLVPPRGNEFLVPRNKRLRGSNYKAVRVTDAAHPSTVWPRCFSSATLLREPLFRPRTTLGRRFITIRPSPDGCHVESLNRNSIITGHV